MSRVIMGLTLTVELISIALVLYQKYTKQPARRLVK